MDVITTCPLGSTCEQAVEGFVERCAWYVKLQGVNPQTNEQVDERRCAMAWQPILMIEGNGVSHKVNASIHSLRNETLKRQDKALEAMNNAKTIECN